MLLISAVAGLSTAAPPLVTLAVDFSGLDRETYDAIAASHVYKDLLVRLVEDQLAFIDEPARADIVVRFARGTGGTVVIHVDTAEGGSERAIAMPANAGEAGELALTHAVLAEVRSARVALAAARAPQPARWAPSARAQAGAFFGPGRGALFETAAGVQKDEVEIAAGVTAHYPLGLPAELAIFEWGAFAGSRYRQAVLAWLEVSAGTDVGVWQSRYAYADPAGHADSGAQLDPMAALHIGMAATVGPAWRVELQTGAYGTLHGRMHRDATAELWRAPAVRPFVGVGVAYVHDQ